MRASRSWPSSHHADRLKERVALLEGATRFSVCRLAHCSKNHDGCISASCCRRRRFSSTLARIQEPQWHYHNRPRRQFSSLTLSPYTNGRNAHLMEKTNIVSHAHASPGFTPISRALGTTNVHICLPTNKSVTREYDYIFFQGRRFACDSNSSSTPKPHPISQIDEADTLNEPIKTKVPKEFIDAIKSEVEEMESSSPPAPHHKKNALAKKTQDDFADYLNRDDAPTVKLEGDSVLGVERQNFAQNELKRRTKKVKRRAKKSSLKFSKRSSAKQKEMIQSPTSASTSSGGNSTISDIDNDGVSNASKTPKEQSETSPPHVYNYKFSTSDATLSDPQRNLDRRRAIEQRLQDQQADSRAATMKNVQRALGGNFIIAVAKLAAALSSGSSAMLSEFVHSVVDCGNQALLLVGLTKMNSAPDRSHPYGYGKAIYFWALVSALGTFFLGAGVSMTHAVGELMNPSLIPTEVGNEVWAVLIMSFAVDGYVFGKTLQGVKASMRIDGEGRNKDMSIWRYGTTKIRDPATLAVLLEDGAACLGVVLAIGGIGLTQYSGMPVFDGMAGVCISGLLAAMGMALANVNHRFLIGQGLDRATREDIEKIILARRSIDNVYSVQSQWTGPDSFSYKAEVDFDGTFLAAKLLPRYQQEFFDAKHTLDRDLRVLLSWYSEDVMRAVEREVRHIEEEIRMKYPAAQYIELEPMSKDQDRYAIDDGMEAQLRRVEIDVLNRYLKSMYKIKTGGPGKDT